VTIKGNAVVGADDVRALPPPARCTHYEYGGEVGWLAIPSNAEPGLVDQVFINLMERMREVAYRDHASTTRPETFHECYEIPGVCRVYLMQIVRMPGAETSDS
jgi:hypothetical protein